LGFSSIAPKDEGHVDIMIVVNEETSTDSLRAYTELWGKGANGEDVAICWLAGIVDVQKIQDESVVALELDIRWVQKAGAQTPFTLKNVLLQDINVFIPIDEAAEVAVEGSLPKMLARLDLPITKEMKTGVFPRELITSNATAAPTLMLLHGYCSDVNPWLKYASDFQDPAFFLAKSTSLTHEQFAQKVVEYAQSLGMTRWSGIGHSQGGMVLVHILTYYFSGLDQSTNGRVIQSVGAPYQGNSGAGTAANLIKIFGYGCGENYDLTTDGSKLWNVGIPNDVRQQVNYYTTTYKQGKFFGDYCNLLVNALLKWPNDGTCEESLSDLKGGVDRGNKEAWCHTTGMAYTAQYYDQTRNQEMNAAAAR
jgi:pimeloyl-ACP methyl ester carboxylesterase